MFELRHALQTLLRSPLFVLAAAGTLALGIAGNTVLFSLIEAAFIRPLPYEDPERLVMLWEENIPRGWRQFGVSTQDFRDWAEQAGSFRGLAAFYTTSANARVTGSAVRARLAFVTDGFFDIMGVGPWLGRDFRPEDPAGSVAILSHSFWMTTTGGDPEVVGGTMDLDGLPHTVLGVMPPGFAFPDDAIDLWRPFRPDANQGGRGSRWVAVVGRLGEGVSLTRARAEMTTLASRLEARYPDTNKDWTVAVNPLRDELVGESGPTLMLLWGAVGLILIMACANAANLLLVRASERSRELAIRSALGAGRGRLVRQALGESLLVAGIGGAAGVGLSWAGLAAARSLPAGTLPFAEEGFLNITVLSFTMALSMITGLLFGLAPAWQICRTSPSESLGGSSRGATAGRTSARWRRGLVALQVAVAMTLLLGAGLLIRSLGRVMDVEPGFQTENVLTLRVAPPRSTYPEHHQAVAFYDALLGGIREMPGVVEAGAINRLPLTGNWWITEFSIEGRPEPPPESTPSVYGRVVTPGYFESLSVPLLRGRRIRPSDDAGSLKVIVINQAMADRHWPGEDPLGRRITFEDPSSGEATWFTIVGVVGDIRHHRLTVAPKPAAYMSVAQTRFGLFPDWGLSVVVKAESNPMELVPGIRLRVRELDAGLPVHEIATARQVLGSSVSRQSLSAWLLLLFAAVAVLQASLGVYGVVAYAVSRRTGEIGIRVALGAVPRQIAGLVLREGAVLSGAGVVLGMLASLWLTRFLQGQLFQVGSTDPLTFLLAPVLLVSMTLLACHVPAWRAARVEPAKALHLD